MQKFLSLPLSRFMFFMFFMLVLVHNRKTATASFNKFSKPSHSTCALCSQEPMSSTNLAGLESGTLILFVSIFVWLCLALFGL
jgi:hypothetical protein